MNYNIGTSWTSQRAVAGLLGAVALTVLAAGQAAAQHQVVIYCGVDENWCRGMVNHLPEGNRRPSRHDPP